MRTPVRRYAVSTLAGLLLCCSVSRAADTIAYVARQGGIDNIVFYDMATAETRMATHFAVPAAINSLSVTGDGQTVYFTRQRPSLPDTSSIWRVRTDGSGLVDITSSQTAVDYANVAVSPDGSLIAYAGRRMTDPVPQTQLYVMDSNGANIRQLTFFPVQAETTAVSSLFFKDNATVFFKTRLNGAEDFWSVRTDGTFLTQLTSNWNNPAVAPYFPRLGRPHIDASGVTLLYGKQTQDAGGMQDWQVVKLHLASRVETAVFTNLYAGAVPPESQPDPMPAYAGGGAIALCGTLDGVSIDLFLTSEGAANPYTDRLTRHAYARLPVPFDMRYPGASYAYSSLGQIYIASAGKPVVNVTPGHTPSLDPRGKRVAFVNGGVWHCAVNGTGLTCLDDNPTASSPVFSPDGNWVVYVKSGDIYARPVDLSQPAVRLTYSPDKGKSDLAFAPDGSFIVFTGTENGRRSVMKLPVSLTPGVAPSITVTGTPVNLTPLSADNFSPAVSADSKTIAFISTRNLSAELWLMANNGSSQRRIVFQSAPVSPAFPAFSPYDPAELSFLAGAPQEVCVITLSDVAAAIRKVVPSITTEERFSWGKTLTGTVETRRSMVFTTLDRVIPLRYTVAISVDVLPTPTGMLIEETVPETWIATGILLNGGLPISPWKQTVANGMRTLTFYFGPTGIQPIRDAFILFQFDLSGDVQGREYVLDGRASISSGSSPTSGDSFVRIGGPGLTEYAPVPLDRNADWLISDYELLDAIELWASTGRIHGWPTDLTQWDYWLLTLIDFWVSDGGYEYDPAASVAQGEPRWQTK